MSYPSKDTIGQLKGVVGRIGTLRKTAVYLGFPESYAAVFSGILNNKKDACSKSKENEIRHALNLFPIGTRRLDQVPTRKLGDLIRWRTQA